MTPRTTERPKTIAINCHGRHVEGKAKASQSLKPGHLVLVDSTATDLPRSPEVLIKCATSGIDTVMRIVKEDALRGKTIADTYADGDIVPFVACLPGDRVMVRVATSFVCTPGAQLKAHTDGTFVAQGGTGKVLCEVEDNVDLSASSSDLFEDLVAVRVV